MNPFIIIHKQMTERRLTDIEWVVFFWLYDDEELRERRFELSRFYHAIKELR